MRKSPVWCAVALATSCTTEMAIPKGAEVTCARNADCPVDYRCNTEKRCVKRDDPDPPHVVLGAVERGVATVDLPVTAFHESEEIDLLVRVDIGNGFEEAIVAPTRIPARPSGAAATISWSAAAQRAGATSYLPGVRIEVTPMKDEQVGSSQTSVDVAVGNDPPRLYLEPLSGEHEGDILIQFELLDTASDVSSVEARFRSDEADVWRAMDTGVSNVDSLSTAPTGEAHALVWHSARDLAVDPSAPQGIGARRIETVQIQLQPRDRVAGEDFLGEPATSLAFVIDNTFNNAPTVALSTPAGTSSGDVSIAYVIKDIEADPCDLTVEFRDASRAWTTAQMGSGGDGVTALASSRDGVVHVFSWSSIDDGVGLSGLDDMVQLRIAATGTVLGAFVESDAFAVDNSSNNTAPALTIDPPAETSGMIPFTYHLSDAESDACDLEVEVLESDQTTWTPCLIAGGDGLANLSSHPSSVAHTFVWHSLAQGVGVIRRDDVRLRLRATQRPPVGGINSGWVESAAFVVDNGDVLNEPPTASVLSPPSWVGPVIVDLFIRLTDVESDDVNLTAIEYSGDGGASWEPATLVTVAGQTADLATSPAGVVHHLQWLAATDFAGMRAPGDVQLRIELSDDYHAGDPAIAAPRWKVATAIEPVQVSSSWNGNPPLVLESDEPGVLHVFWAVFGGGLEYRRSLDWGITWTEPNTPATGEIWAVRAAVVGRAVFLAYSLNATTADVQVISSHDRGTTWSAPVNASQTGNASGVLLEELVADHAGTLHLVYRHTSWLHRASADGGSSWSPAAPVSWGRQPYELVVDDDNALHLAVVDPNGAGADRVLHYRSADGGTSWVSDVVYAAPDVSVDLANARLAIGRGMEWVVWEEETIFTATPTARAAARTTGGTWQSVLDIPDADEPRVAIDDRGGVHLIFRENDQIAMTADPLQWTASGDGGATWSKPFQLNELNEAEASLTQSHGVLTAVWGVSSADIKATAWTGDGAGAWAIPTRLPWPREVQFPSVNLEEGRLHVLSSHGARGLEVSYASTADSGRSWTAQINLGLGGGPLAVAGGPNGLVHAIWTNVWGGLDEELMHAYSSNEGRDWSQPAAVGVSANDPIVDVDLHVNDQGVVNAAWTYGDYSGKTERSRFVGGGWEAPVTVANNWYQVSLAEGADHRLHLAVANMTYFYSDDGGATWSAAVPIDSGLPLVGFIDMEIASTGVIHIVWLNNWTAQHISSSDGGDTWSPVHSIAQDIWRLKLGIDGTDRLHVALTTRIVPNVLAASSSDGGVTWTGYANLGTDNSRDRSGNWTGATIAGSEDAAHVVWSDDGHGGDRAISCAIYRDAYRFQAPLDAPLVIPDGNSAGLSNEMVLSAGSFTPREVRVGVEVDHPDRGQLRLSVTFTPTGEDPISVALADHGGSGALRGAVVYDDESNPPIESLSNLAGRPMDGTWSLTVIDDVAGGTGTIDGWWLETR